jgi:hypothetical protein
MGESALQQSILNLEERYRKLLLTDESRKKIEGTIHDRLDWK